MLWVLERKVSMKWFLKFGPRSGPIACWSESQQMSTDA